MTFRTAKFIRMEDAKTGGVFDGGIIDNTEPNLIPYANSPY
jgi:hypothetical protein